MPEALTQLELFTIVSKHIYNTNRAFIWRTSTITIVCYFDSIQFSFFCNADLISRKVGKSFANHLHVRAQVQVKSYWSEIFFISFKGFLFFYLLITSAVALWFWKIKRKSQVSEKASRTWQNYSICCLHKAIIILKCLKLN